MRRSGRRGQAGGFMMNRVFRATEAGVLRRAGRERACGTHVGVPRDYPHGPLCAPPKVLQILNAVHGRPPLRNGHGQVAVAKVEPVVDNNQIRVALQAARNRRRRAGQRGEVEISACLVIRSRWEGQGEPHLAELNEHIISNDAKVLDSQAGAASAVPVQQGQGAPGLPMQTEELVGTSGGFLCHTGAHHVASAQLPHDVAGALEPHLEVLNLCTDKESDYGVRQAISLSTVAYSLVRSVPFQALEDSDGL